MTFSFRLMEIVCHASYPLNSANATPPGTFTLYLSCAEMTSPARSPTHSAVTPIVITLLRFIQYLLEATRRTLVGGLNPRRLDEGIGRRYTWEFLAQFRETPRGTGRRDDMDA